VNVGECLDALALRSGGSKVMSELIQGQSLFTNLSAFYVAS
jgi:hypothetical protein